MDKRPDSIAERVFVLLLALLAIAAMAGAVRLGFGSWRQPGAGLFPFLAGVLIFVAALVVIVNSFRRKQEHDGAPLGKRDFATLVALILVFAGWIVVMPLLGYIVVTFAGVFALARIFGLRGWLKPALLAAGTSLAVYLLFDRLLYLDLPRGLFGLDE